MCLSHFVTKGTYAYKSPKNNDNDMKLSGYDPWGSRLDQKCSELDLTCSQVDLICVQLEFDNVM